MSQVLTESAKVTAIRVKTANKFIFRALLSLASAAILARMFGMLNQLVVSSRFGAGTRMDAYFVAIALPLLFAQLIVNAIESAVIPTYARLRSQGNKERTSSLFSTVLNLLLLGSVLLTLVMLLFRQQLIFLSAPALDPYRLGLASGLTIYTYPVFILMVVIGFLECIFNTEGQFGWPAYAGLLVPLTTAILVLAVGPSLGVVMLCIGMITGLCLQLCVFIYRMQRAKLRYRFVMDLRHPEIGLIFNAAWPVMLGALIIQASPIVDQIFASFLPTGSISAISYSLKLISVPVGVIFASVGRAILPYLSHHASIRDMKAFKETFHLYWWVVILGTLALSLLLIVLAHPLVQLFFQHGAFTAKDTNRTATTLIGFLVGLAPMSSGFITSKAFNALGKNRILAVISIFSVIANAIFDCIFAHFLQSQGIAIATSVVYFCSMLIQLFILYRMLGKIHFLKPPHQILNLVQKIGKGNYYPKWLNLKRDTDFASPLDLRKQIVRVGLILAVFAVGTIGTLLNSLYTLRVSWGSIIILVFLRYRFALLVTWAILDAFIGSTISIFNGNNFVTILSIPTLLLLSSMPLQQTFKRLPALAFLLIFLLWVLVGGVGPFLTQWIFLLQYVAVGVLTINLLTTQQRLMRLIDIIMLPCTFIALYGIYGFITKQNGIIDPTTSFRIFSIFNSSPPTALYFSIITPLAIYRATTLQGFKRIGVTILVIIYIAALVLTFTRAAFVIFPLSIITMILFIPSRRMKISLFSGILVLTVIVFLLVRSGNIAIFNRFSNQDIMTFNNRTYLWQVLLDHFDPRQLLGNGFRKSETLLLNLRLNSIDPSSANLYIAALYDEGIIGFVLLIILFIALLISLIKGVRKTSGGQRALFVVALATFINMVLLSFDANDMWTPAISLYFWIIMALPFALCWSASVPSSSCNNGIVDQVTEPQLETVQQEKSMYVLY